MTAETPGTPMPWNPSNPEWWKSQIKYRAEQIGWDGVYQWLVNEYEEARSERRERVDPDVRARINEVLDETLHEWWDDDHGNGALHACRPVPSETEFLELAAKNGLTIGLAATEPSRDPSGVKHDPTECADCARIKGVVIAPHDLACGRSPGQPDPLCAACAATDAATPDHTEGGDAAEPRLRPAGTPWDGRPFTDAELEAATDLPDHTEGGEEPT